MSIFKNRTVIGVICILLALVICFGITPLFNQSISQKAEIVRVTKDIHAGELITKDMVATAEVGSYNLPSAGHLRHHQELRHRTVRQAPERRHRIGHRGRLSGGR